MQEMIKDLSIEYLMSTPIGDGLEKAMALYEQMQERLYAAVSTSDSAALIKLKAGTVLTLAVLKKLAEGKDPRKLTKEDWEDIARQAAEYAGQTEGENYSLFVFGLYADYIHWSAQLLKGSAPETRIEEIEKLSEELRLKAALLREGKITETAFIEDSLWICLEAMVKLLSSSLHFVKGTSDAAELAHAAGTFAFEYGRLRLWQKEQALLTEYLDHQKELDQELEAKFDAFRADLEADSAKFDELISRAFEPGFRDMLKDSVALAKAAGVKEEEILDTVEKVDSFFMD